MKLQFGFDTAFNGDGEKSDPLLVRNFLSQRKWVMLCGAFVALVSNNYLSLHGKWLIFAAHIDFSSVGLLRTISGTGILFGLYMFFSRFPFIQKFKDLQRNAFNELKLEKQSSVLEEDESLKEQRSEIDKRLFDSAEEHASLAKRSNAFITSTHALAEYLEAVGRQPSGRTIPPSDDLAKAMEFLEVPLSQFEEGFNYEQIEQAIYETENEIENLRRKMNSNKELRNQLRENQFALSEQETKLQSRLLALVQKDEKMWKKFYAQRLKSTGISLLPSLLSLFYCAYYLCYESFQ